MPNYLRQVVISPDGASAIVPSKKDNVLRGAARDGLALTFETSVRTIVSRLDLTNNVELLDQRLDFNNRALGLAAAYSPRGDYFLVAMLGSGGIATGEPARSATASETPWCRTCSRSTTARTNAKPAAAAAGLPSRRAVRPVGFSSCCSASV